MGKMIFTVLGAVAELERNLIKERVHMGISRARKQGKQLGRPKRIFDREKARTMLKYMSAREVASNLWSVEEWSSVHALSVQKHDQVTAHENATGLRPSSKRIRLERARDVR
jgi:DNA invertase Pin-like site-specific DNA recombinase